jgi:hypothetical protein
MKKLDLYGECPACGAPWLEDFEEDGEPMSRLLGLEEGECVECPDCGAFFDPDTGEEIESELE